MNLFLSYNSQDAPTAASLAAALETADSDLRVYFAPKSLRLGTFWLPDLGEALERADAFLFLFGKAVGRWQRLEYYEALDRMADGVGLQLISVITVPGHAPGLPLFSQLQWIEAPDPCKPPVVAEIVQGLSEPGAPQRKPWQLVNPFRGLERMREEDAAFFFGRNALVGSVLKQLQRNPPKVQVLVGNSGVGKSSIVDAGVFGALHSQLWPGAGHADWPHQLRDSRRWLRLSFKPGEDPLAALADACLKDHIASTAERGSETLGWVRNFRKGSSFGDLWRILESKYRDADLEPPTRLVLSIDQGEELYSRARVKTPEDAKRFSEIIAQAAEDDRVTVLMSLRSDHYGHLQDDTALARACDRIDVLPLDEAQLAEVVGSPAEALEATFEDDALRDRIVEAAKDQPGGLPVLSYLLRDMWSAMQQADDGVLRWQREVIDIAGPLVKRADDFLAAHEDRETHVKWLFCLRLVHVPQTGEPVRRRALMKDLTPEERQLAYELAEEAFRLVTTGEDRDGAATVELAHETLTTNWPRLAAWLTEEHDFLVWRGRVEADQLRWIDAARSSEALLTGISLREAERWLETHAARITDDDTKFIEASTSHRDAERNRAEEQERQLREEQLLREKLAREKAEQEQRLKEEQLANERLAREKAEQEQRLKEEQLAKERLAREKAEREAQTAAAAARRTVRRTRVAVVLGVLAVLLSPVAESVYWAWSYGIPPELEVAKTRWAYLLGMQGHTMVMGPEGSFMMGSKEEEGNETEKPEHKVTFEQSFRLSATEVTFAQYDPFAAATGREPPHDEGWGRGKRPVINVSWEDAQAYVRWLSAKTDQSCRLPTEAEWEYACRAGTTTRYAFGDEIAEEDANFGGNVGNTTEVGAYHANDWGLHDMHGNVWEWVEDCWHDSYEGAPDDGQAWLEDNGGDCETRVLRGGSWGYVQGSARCAFRVRLNPNDRFDGLGFRVLCSSPIVDR
ncbi:MAG: SUMF1/EgtB/PvdO family nonheme iron enzyme [Kiloniellales bacterium]|nr:SUMF1/EgtB/PvdO family nonheme iron enzyme [Kiloniellales bacterium]